MSTLRERLREVGDPRARRAMVNVDDAWLAADELDAKDARIAELEACLTWLNAGAGNQLRLLARHSNLGEGVDEWLHRIDAALGKAP